LSAGRREALAAGALFLLQAVLLAHTWGFALALRLADPGLFDEGGGVGRHPLPATLRAEERNARAG
jgi:hypothetical protein